MPSVLIIEDSPGKFDALSGVVAQAWPSAEVTHCATIVEAERALATETWNLIVLDISMDIAPSSIGPKGRGQANIGGLAIAQRMFLLERESPTVIVTAFDSFAAPTMGAGVSEIVGFEEVRIRATEFLGRSLLACIQYNSATWKEQMRVAISKVSQP